MSFESSWISEFLDQRLVTNFLTAGKPPGPEHHIFLDSLATDTNQMTANTRLLFQELGNRINPATGRPYFDLGNNSDNMISLLGSQGGAATSGLTGDHRPAAAPDRSAEPARRTDPTHTP